MVTLWKRATPSQYRMLRAIAGAVHNAAHAHHAVLPRGFARSVAKRATGTLTAQWADVLAAKTSRRQDGSRDNYVSRGPRGSSPAEGHPKGDRLSLTRRSPLRELWKKFAAGMWKVKHGPPEIYAAHVRILKLLDQARIEYEGISDAVGQPGKP